jgi:hypothetical protein
VGRKWHESKAVSEIVDQERKDEGADQDVVDAGHAEPIWEEVMNQDVSRESN